MGGLIAQVVGRDDPVTEELALKAQAPLLNVHVVQGERQVDIRGGGWEHGRRSRRIWEGERIAAGISLEWIDESARRSGDSDLISQGAASERSRSVYDSGWSKKIP